MIHVNESIIYIASRFPAPAASGGRRLRSTACNNRTTPLVPLMRYGNQSALLRLRRNRTSFFACASLVLPNRGRRVAFGSSYPAPAGSLAKSFWTSGGLIGSSGFFPDWL